MDPCTSLDNMQFCDCRLEAVRYTEDEDLTIVSGTFCCLALMLGKFKACSATMH